MRILVGESAKSVDRLRQDLEFSYAPALAAFSGANHSAAKRARELVIQESAEVKVAVSHFCDHLEASEKEIKSFGETVSEWGDGQSGNKGKKLNLLPWYEEIKPTVDLHDQLWIHLCDIEEEYADLEGMGKDGNPIPQQIRDQVKRRFTEADEDYTKSYRQMEDLIRKYRRMKTQAYQEMLGDLVNSEMQVHIKAMERLTNLAQRVMVIPGHEQGTARHLPTSKTQPPPGTTQELNPTAQKDCVCESEKVEIWVDGGFKPWNKAVSEIRPARAQHRRLPPKTINILKSLPHRFGATMSLQDVDCLLRELVYEMPFSADGISHVSQRIYTIFAPPQHAMAALGLSRHPGADRPGTLRTVDLAVGLGVVITEGDLEDRMRNAFDVHDTTGIGRVDRAYIASFLKILSKHVVGLETLEPILEGMFLKGDSDFDGHISFVEFWAYANANVEVLNWMSLYAHHLGAMLGQGQIGYLYMQQLRRQPQNLSPALA